MNEKNEKATFELEAVQYDNEMGDWVATFSAKVKPCKVFKIEVSMGDAHRSDDDLGPRRPKMQIETASLRLREKVHEALQNILDASAQGLRKADAQLPGASGD